MISNVLLRETIVRKMLPYPQDSSCFNSLCVATDPNPMDLNTKTLLASGAVDNCKVSITEDNGLGSYPSSARHIGLDQNKYCAFSSAGRNSYNPHRLPGYVKSVEVSECESPTGPLEESDSYRKWKELKQNGFLSSAHVGVPVPEKTQHSKKRKNDQLKKKKSDPVKQKMEIAKREQVQRFTRAPLPSGLLNGLKPGIISHVRNSKQVHSIIAALVRSERQENNIQRASSQFKGESDTNGKAKITENLNDKEVSQLEHKGGCCNTGIADRQLCVETPGASHVTSDREAEMLTLKLSSLTTAASESCSAPNELVGNRASVSSLSARALPRRKIKKRVQAAPSKLVVKHASVTPICAKALQRHRCKLIAQAVIKAKALFLRGEEFRSNWSFEKGWNYITEEMRKAILSKKGKHFVRQGASSQRSCSLH